MEKISIFANFCIDSEERFLRLKDSFFSFNKADISCWRINIRGKYKSKVDAFLKDNIKNNLKISFLDTDRGWLEDTKEIAKDINTFLIFIWVEDHICIKNIENFNNIINEMFLKKVDNLNYSFYHNGRYKIPLKYVEHEICQNISIFDFNKKNYELIEENISNPIYPITQPAIMSLNFFNKNLDCSKNKLKYNIQLPFNFEKDFSETKKFNLLNFKNAVLNNELFVSIDDDKNCPNSSLISRNLYPNRINRDKLLIFRDLKYNYFHKDNFLKKIKNSFLRIFKSYF